MKKVYRASQMRHILGRRIGGLSMHKYGLPYNGAAGGFFPEDQDSIDLMLAAVERHPELHVVSRLQNDWYVNRYEPDARWYLLHLGNADPEIEFNTTHSDEDTTDEERREFIEFMEKNRATLFDLDPVETAAMNWFFENRLKPKKHSK